MTAVVDQVLKTFALSRGLELAALDESRTRVTRYIEKLSAAGHTDSGELAIYGLAYLKDVYDGPEPRYTGC